MGASVQTKWMSMLNECLCFDFDLVQHVVPSLSRS
jgi:hypothetical protein